MKYTILLVSFFLTGCVTTSPKFPDIPPELQKKCPDLNELAAGTEKMSDLLDTVTANYKIYHDCRARVEGWQEWYNTQKEIFNDSR